MDFSLERYQGSLAFLYHNLLTSYNRFLGTHFELDPRKILEYAQSQCIDLVLLSASHHFDHSGEKTLEFINPVFHLYGSGRHETYYTHSFQSPETIRAYIRDAKKIAKSLGVKLHTDGEKIEETVRKLQKN